MQKVDDTMTKENIIIAALRLFLMKGYASVSLMDVAKEVGITKGGIYHYFSSKEELLNVAIYFFLDRFEEKYMSLLTKNESIQAILECLLVKQEQETYVAALLGTEEKFNIDYAHSGIEIVRKIPGVLARMEQINAAVCELFTKKIEQAIQAGQMKDCGDSYASAASILSMINGYKSLGEQFQTEAMRKRLADTIWQSIKK